MTHKSTLLNIAALTLLFSSSAMADMGYPASAPATLQSVTGWQTTDPGDYATSKSKLNPWSLDKKQETVTFHYEGSYVACSSGMEFCNIKHEEGKQSQWAWATAFAVKGKIPFFDAFEGTLTETFTKTRTETSTDGADGRIKKGQKWKFVSYMPRYKGAAQFAGKMIDMNQSITRKVCHGHPSRCTGGISEQKQYKYVWQPEYTMTTTAEGHRNQLDKPIWSFQQYGRAITGQNWRTY